MSAHATVNRCVGCGETDPSTERCGTGEGVLFARWVPRHTLVPVCTECGAKGDELTLPCLAVPQRPPERRGETPPEEREAAALYRGFTDHHGRGSWSRLLRELGLD